LQWPRAEIQFILGVAMIQRDEQNLKQKARNSAKAKLI
jgi:hypothetical protein